MICVDDDGKTKKKKIEEEVEEDGMKTQTQYKIECVYNIVVFILFHFGLTENINCLKVLSQAWTRRRKRPEFNVEHIS